MPGQNALRFFRLLGATLILFAIMASPARATAPQETSASPVPQAEAPPAVPALPDIADAAKGDTTLNEAFLVAERALEEPPADYTLLEAAELSDLRDRLARVRDSARALADDGTLETRILGAQIEALGPLPAEGEIEPSAITERRAQLDRELAERLPPVLAAQATQVRAATIVGELDAHLRKIGRERMLRFSASPLDPRTWFAAAAGIISRSTQAFAAFAEAWTGPDGSKVRMQALAAVAIVALGFLIGAFLPRRVLGWIDRRTAASPVPTKRLLWILLHDVVAAILVMTAALFAAFAVILLLEPLLPSTGWASVAVTLVFAAVIVMIAGWLGQSVLLSPFDELRIIKLEDADALRGKRIIRWIGVIVAAETILALAESEATVDMALSNLISAILVLVGAWLTWQLIDIIRLRKRPEAGAEYLAGEDAVASPDGEVLDYIGPLTRLARVVIIATVIAALLGFVALAREVFISTVATLAVIAIALYLHRSIKLIFRLLAEGKLNRFRGILHFIPMLTGILITLGTLPIIAIIWGYQSQEIGDAVIALRTGVEFGDVRLSAGDVMTFMLVFFLGYVATRWVQRILRLSLLPQFSLDIGARSAIVTMVGYVGIVLAAVIAIATTGLDLSNLAFVAGALSVGLGFGLQSVVENFTSGIILLLERPVREGDWIQVGENSGIVRKISVRSTRLETWDKNQIIIPNSELITGSVTNLSIGEFAARSSVDIGVAYGTDLDAVKKDLLTLAREHELVMQSPEPFVTLEQFGESSVDLKLFFFVADATKGAGVRSDIRFAMARTFAEKGVEIPYPQRELRVRSLPEGGIPIARET